MGLLSGPKNTVQKWNAIRTNSSILGITIPILFGQHRLAGRLIWYGDFVAKHAKQQGGKGLLKGGVQYVYTASVIALLAHGPLNYLLNVWDSNGRFQLFSASESYTITSGAGLNYTSLNASIYANDQGVAHPTAYSVGPFTDFGSPGPVTLSGTQNVPFTVVTSSPATGQYSVNQTTGVYTFAAADVGKTVTINYSYYRYRLITEELTVVPFTPGPYTVTVDNSTSFTADDGVSYYPSGTAFVKVGGGPAVGQYSQSGPTYTFNSADQGQGIVINYEYTDPNTDTNAPNQLNLTLVNGALGQAPLSYMTGKHPSQALGYSLDSYIFSSGLYLGYSPELPNYSYEVAGAFQVGGGIVDCNPADCIEAVLTDPHFGVGFPTNLIGDLTLAEQAWAANSFFISPFIDNSKSCSGVMKEWLEAGMVAAFWSEAQLKFVPYVDTTAVGNGVTYSPPTAPVASFTDDQYLVDKADDPIKIERTAWQDVYNRVRVNYLARVNDYNPEVVYEQDDASITRFGLRIKDPLQYDFITTLPAAQYAASLAVQRNCYIRNTYTFRAPDIFSALEPMDVIKLTDSILGLNATPARITKIEDDPQKGLTITAETFLWGPAAPAFNPKQINGPTGGGDPHADPGNTNVIIFEAPNRLGLFSADQLYMFVSGKNSNWGGCHIWVSYDGTNYSLYGPPGGLPLTQPARIGTLNGLPGGNDPFTAANDIANNWTAVRGTFSGPPSGFVQVATLATSPSDAAMFYSANNPSSPDYWSQLQISTVGTGSPFHSLGPACRIQNGADTYYGISYTSLTLTLFKMVAGTRTDLGIVSYSALAGDVHRIEAVGTTITASLNGVIVISVTDSSISATGGWGICGAGGVGLAKGTNWLGGQAGLPSYGGANPDTTDTAHVQLTQNGDTLLSVSSAAAAQGVSLCALFNYVSGNFELFSYQTATLEGSSAYALTTLYRGLLNTAASAHVTGEQFARLDQASLIFQYDPSYIGKTISFKFTSFNLYGQMEQDIANVQAITFPLAGVGVGMYSLVNGQINSTFYMQQVQAVATILSGMGLTQSGTSTTILMASGVVQYGSGTVSYSSASVNPGSLGTWYCYFNDPTYAGGSITLLATQTVPTLVSAPGYFYVGAITTAGGGGGTGGGGGGGTGGGGCFSGNVKIETALDGFVAFEELPSTVVIKNKRGVHAANLLIHDYDGPMIDIGNGLLVTEDHNMVTPEGDIMRAREYFSGCKTVPYKGKVYNLCVHTADESERHYILETGDIAHNSKFYK